MANPQAENGHVDISNEVMDALISHRISGEEMQCLLFIIRKTWGWKKKEDQISLSQFVQATGMNRRSCRRALDALCAKKRIGVRNIAHREANLYSFNKDFDLWVRNIAPMRNFDRKLCAIKRTTKDNIQKTNTPPDFLTFWKCYPNRVGKGAAEKAWKKNGRPTLEVILKAIEKQKAWRNNAQGKFRPEWKHPATWLNQKCWEDEVDAGGSSAKPTLTG